MTFFQALILGIVEGITEFLPISSTGHMILVSAWLGIHENTFVQSFEIAIQLGAIAAIVLRFIPRLSSLKQLYQKVFVAFLPAAAVGFLVYPLLKQYLFGPIVVAVSLIVGGIVLLFVDTKNAKGDKKQSEQPHDLTEITYKQAVLIGCFQSISIIPGVSRAAATIIGGLQVGLSKRQAMEFSFLLAIPTMAAATAYDMYKSAHSFSQNEVALLLVGAIVAGIFAWFAVEWFVGVVEKQGFRYFGVYRIILGIVSLLYFLR